MLSKEEFEILVKGTGVLSYTYTCSVCGKEVQNKNARHVLRKRFERQDWEKFTMCRSCTIKDGRKHRTVEDEQKALEKRKQTCLKRYGVTNATYIPTHNEKTKQTCLKKYGVENPSQAQSVKEKKKQTLTQHYGVDNPWKIEEIKNKIKQTCLKKYGVDNPWKNKDVLEKRKQTCVEKYGTSCYRKSTQFKNYLKKIWSDVEKRKQLSNTIKNTLSKRTAEDWRQIRMKVARKYVYKDQSFDSSWELAVYVWAIDQGKHVTREPVSFAYEFEGQTRTYIPDFDIDGQLVEIKGDHFFKDGNMQNPFDFTDLRPEAKHQCGIKHDVQFWSKKEVQPALDYMEKQYGKQWVELFKK